MLAVVLGVVVVVLAQPDGDVTRFPDLADARFFVVTFEGSLQAQTIGFKFRQMLTRYQAVVSPEDMVFCASLLGEGCHGTQSMWTIVAMAMSFKVTLSFGDCFNQSSEAVTLSGSLRT
jgi:hypothetical protein